MSPGEASGVWQLADKLEQTRRALERLGGALADSARELERDPTGPFDARLALGLDRLYTALEDGLLAILRTVDLAVPEGADWHQSVLRQSLQTVPDLRPPICRPETASSAEKLLAFRHFLRHAYPVALDPTRLLALAADAEALVAAAIADLTAFTSFLRQATAF